MAMAERQSAHRERIETKVINGNVAGQTRGSWFGFIIALVVILGGFFLLYEGKSIAGLTAILASLASLVSVFFYSKYEQKRERTAKAEVMPRPRRQN